MSSATFEFRSLPIELQTEIIGRSTQATILDLSTYPLVNQKKRLTLILARVSKDIHRLTIPVIYNSIDLSYHYTSSRELRHHPQPNDPLMDEMEIIEPRQKRFLEL